MPQLPSRSQPMDASSPPPPLILPTITSDPHADLSTLSDDELEREILELTLEIEQRKDTRIGVLERYIAHLDVHDAALAQVENRLARIDDRMKREIADEGDRERWRNKGNRPWPMGNAQH